MQLVKTAQMLISESDVEADKIFQICMCNITKRMCLLTNGNCYSGLRWLYVWNRNRDQ